MENSPLNKAHQQYRRAEALLKQKKFDECIDCHERAIGLLNETLEITENHRSLESIRLQKKYHQKQIEFVRMKKVQQENDKNTMDNEKRETSLFSNEFVCHNIDQNLEATIFRTMEVHDSLIGYLGKRGAASDTDSLKSYSTSDTEEKIDKTDGPTQIVGLKHPKDDSTIIEELKLLSGQLRDSVHCLLIQLDERNKEIDKLKSRIKQLEIEKSKGIGQPKNNNNLKVVTDSSGGTSPYILSPCSELSPDVHDTRLLPPLAPLEMPPNIDFNSLIKSNNTSFVNSTK